MQVLNYLLRTLKGSVRNLQIKNTVTVIPKTIILLDGVTPLKPQSICIGSQRDIFHTIKNSILPRDILFFTPADETHRTWSLPNLNLIETDLELIPLYNKLNTALAALSRESARPSPNQSKFEAFFRQVLSMELSGEEEIKSAMRGLDYWSEHAYNMIVIETQNPETSGAFFEKAGDMLMQILPTSNMTFFANRLVIMYHGESRIVGFPSNIRTQLQEFLVQFDACAGISNQTRNFEMIRTEYIIASSILNIARKMRQDPGERVFLQEEYGTYYILNLCYKQFEQIFHHQNIIYLTHPGLSALIRYDEKHHTNLREVLLCYLLNDRSLTKTSKLLFMHRNTTMNKINRITQIIEDDLEDSHIRQRLLFSCMLYDYCEKFSRKPFHVSAEDSDE